MQEAALTTPRPLVHPAELVDDFEARRQQLETRNEILISYVRGVMVLVAFGAHLGTRLFPGAPFLSPWTLIGTLGGLLLMNGLLLYYLHGQPAYHPARKFLITAVDLLGLTLSAGQLQGVFPPLMMSLIPVIVFLVMVILSGLRYDTRVVVMAGVMAVLIQIVVFTGSAPPGYRVLITLAGTVHLVAGSVVVAYIVASLLRLHRESVWKERLSRFLAPELVEEIGRKPEILHQKTEHRVVTIIFIDIRGFTTLSERMTPEQVVEFLNKFLDEMTQALMDHHGMLDKYIGDAVMGVFGVPVGGDDDALRAVKCGLDMVARLGNLNQQLQGLELPQLGIGVGIHTGEVVVGAIGSSRRLDYTVIGDAVNVASRIEALTRKYPVSILLSDTTRSAIGEAIPLRQVDTVQVKGREQPVMLWTPA